MNSIFLISLIFLGISFLVSSALKSKFSKYAQIALAKGLSGKEIAEKMDYSKFSQDFNTAFNKLLAYFQELGFEQIPKISRKLVFMNLGNRYEKLEAIELD